MKEIDPFWGSWFAGFTDGEGSFEIRKNIYENPRTNYECRFRITLRNDDRAILEKIHETLKIGTMQDYSARICGNYITRPTSTFRISATNECAELVKAFEKYPLRAKKKQDFEIWKQAVAELNKPAVERNSDLLDYCFLKIKEVRQYEEQEVLMKPIIKELQLTIKFAEGE